MDNNLNFSQRMGLTPIKAIQTKSIDDELLNGLWNVLYTSLESLREQKSNVFYDYFRTLWIDYFKRKVDEISGYPSKYIKNHFCENFVLEWYEKYDFLEFYYQFLTQVPITHSFGIPPVEYFDDNQNQFSDYYSYEDLIKSIFDKNLLLENLAIDFEINWNKILEREFSAFRFINGKIAPITNPIEIEGITNALNETGKFSTFKGSNVHLARSLELLSDKQNPDYRNSIKESISAVEAICKTIQGSENSTLAPALDKIKSKIGLHNALAEGFKKLYGYTSDESGIRHALTDASTCDFDDAKYMLVSCSAFINYLIAKSRKAGINLNWFSIY